MNENIKQILILIVVLVIFTFVTGAHKGTEYFDRECDKIYRSYPDNACPSKCSKVRPAPNNHSGWICTK